MRTQILRRDLRHKMFAPAGERCEVLSGRLPDPYTRQLIRFAIGNDALDIDHVVALGDAWQKGAQQWSYARRVAFANDPLNLLAVDASARGRRRRRPLATSQQELPLRLRREADRDQAQVPRLGHARRARCHESHPDRLPRNPPADTRAHPRTPRSRRPVIRRHGPPTIRAPFRNR
jgi:hypothetical protein